jgi:hypothetical protein
LPEKGFNGAHRSFEPLRRLARETGTQGVDFPVWMIRLLDKEAKRLDVPRQAIIKVWIGERLEKAG